MTGMGGFPIEAYRADIERLCRQYHVRSLALFGSGAGEDFDPERSDLDFLVEFEPLAPGTQADTYFGLRESLERLLGRRIDLVMASAIRNPYFRRAVESTKRVLYAA